MNIGEQIELKVAQLASEIGIDISFPHGELRYDQIWDIKGKLYKIQIKNAELIKNGCAIKFSNQSKKKYKPNEIDAIVTTYNDKLYYIPYKEITCEDKTLWFSLPKESIMNAHQVNWADDYELTIERLKIIFK